MSAGSGPALLVLVAVLATSLAWPARRVPQGAGRSDTAGSGGERGQARIGVRDQRAAREDVAELLALLAAPLRAGVAPGAAVGAALNAAGPLHHTLEHLVGELRRRAQSGDGLAAAWLTHGEALGSADLYWVGQAWLLTERTGAPLAPALVEAERVLRGRARAEARLHTVAAGPRASMAVLSVLPLTGPLVGAAFGLDPGSLYLATPLSVASGALGLVLALTGWWWGRRILAGALGPARQPRRPPSARRPP